MSRKALCVKCETEFKIERNGVVVAEMFQENTKVYRLWFADLWKCPVCGAEIINGYGQEPIAEHFQADLPLMIHEYRERGTRVVISWQRGVRPCETKPK